MRLRTRLWLYGGFVFMRWWYTLSQILTRKNVTLPVFATFDEIIAHLDYGKDYKPDPIRGILDVLNHVTKMERRIQRHQKIEDCDGHAAYWCQALVRSHLSTKTYFATFAMVDNVTGKQSSHCVCVFRDGDTRYWCDYNDPVVYENDWDWAQASAANFNATAVAATLTDVDITKSGRVKFGRMRTHLFPEPHHG